MGRFAALLGLNVGGSVRVELDKREYVAGDVLRGVAYVNVKRPVNAEELMVVITGKEKISWRERSVVVGQSKHYRHHSDSNNFFNQQIVLTRLPAIYTPGDYVYPFQYMLPPSLPGITTFRAGHFTETLMSVKAKVQYALKVRLRANGFFVADLAAKYDLQLHAQPPPLLYQHALIERTGTGKVKALTFVHQGTCDISGVLTQSAATCGTTVTVHATVHNNSTRRLKAVVLELVQTVDVRSCYDDTTRIVETLEVPGVSAGESLTHTLALTLPHAMPPTCVTATLFDVHYALRLKCKYTCCPSPWLDFPLTVLAAGSVSSTSSGDADTAQMMDVPLAIPVNVR